MLATAESISLTDNAVVKIKSLIAAKGNKNLKLRIYIVGGGCSGFQYGFNLDEKNEEDDLLLSFQGVFVVIDPMSFQYLQGACIDYVENLQGSQFKVQNPNAETTCGCGSSFSLKE